MSLDPIALAERLIACPSVTPADAGAMGVLAHVLEGIGFTVHRFAAGEAPDGPIENLFAMRGHGAPHFAFAGHTDVVPAGEGWSADPFVPAIRGDLLYGRGAVDMKGAIAAFVAAADRVSEHHGTLSLIITGDEEGPATYGTVALIDWMAARGIRPDLCLVGEPTSTHRLGDMVKIGRRGSVNIWIEVPGTQGHVAYPHLADNPVPRLIAALDALAKLHLDDGNDWFQPSNLEITTVDVGNGATNLIPGAARARINIRFNDEHRGVDLIARVEAIVKAHAPTANVRGIVSGESFVTKPGALSTLVADAIRERTGIDPELSTTGGTSDARFLSRLCPVVEFGLPNATMHKLDEAAAVADIEALADIYADIIRAALA
ncbi:succinyl-diaminopimelate desuccinylase [Sphingomonas montanisoli]|uniref:Succinyl-diaminopimelate desuccinylase n=1 Tax=Sphingomonas montanisoli TaxID=2606412 RepID=A0A5D9CD42_9SPHN|nr:succinyl-diaminopimelate desuccinylase [Sphingomonas montanisoli]TZG29173.1 succinyl-diaminopimelate desuccinylase [Sphingomonas montanisoli]